MARVQSGERQAWWYRSPAQISRPAHPYVDYGGQLQAVTALAQYALRANTRSSICAFGYAGTGKSSFSEPLAWKLKREGGKFGLLFLDGLKFQSLSEREARREHRSMNQVIESASHPMIVHIDEADAFAPDRDRSETQDACTFWAMDVINSLRARPSLVIGSSNEPTHIDQGVANRLRAKIYFPRANRQLLVGIAKEWGIPWYEPLADAYLEVCGDSLAPVPRSFMDAWAHVKPKRRRSSSRGRPGLVWNGLSAADCAAAMCDFCSPPDRVIFDAYEARHANLIAQFERLKKKWLPLLT
jgi:hypothetical protein